MSNTIDERIVEMSFDNKKFEKGIAQSQKSLKEFNKALNFDGATSGVDKVIASFSKMEAMTLSVINNLTNRVVNFGLRAAKSLTVKPVIDGMGDYNTKLTTMQTITNATGKSIEQVEEYFEQLDTYADKTIYNLTDMTSALAKFTNANVALEKSVPAIKGVANMTALAGQNAQAASIAMYNISQSIAGGFLTTLDFKSLNLANVATFEWKNQMVQAAVAAGTLKQSANGYVTSTGKAYNVSQLFTEALSEQWATTDVLLKVLGDYGDETTEIGKKAQAAAQDVKSFSMMVETLQAAIGTGWTRSFELIFGNLEEGKQLWTAITNAAGAFLDTIANGRNIMLEFWHDNGGRDAFLKGLRNVAIALITVLLMISKAMDQIFPPKTQQQFVNMFKTFENITSKLIMSEETADKLQRTFAGLFSIVDVGIEVVKFFASIIGQIASAVFPDLSGGLLDITANIGDVLVVLGALITDTGMFQNALSYTGPSITAFVDGLRSALYVVVGFISGLVQGTVSIEEVGYAIGGLLGGIGEFVSLLFKGESVTTAFASSFTDVGKSLNDGTTETNAFASAFANGLQNIKNFISIAGSKLIPILAWIGEKISDIGVKELGVIAVGVGLIAISKSILRFLSPISNIMDGFSDVLKSVSKTLSGFAMNIKANALFTIAKSIALLVISLVALAFIPTDKLVKGLGALTILMGELIAAMLLLNKIKDPAKIGVQLAALSTGLFIVGKAAANFSKISWEGLAKAGVSIASFLTMITIFSKTLSANNVGKIQVSLISISLGLVALSGALTLLGNMPFNTILQGMGALAALLILLGTYSKMMTGRDFSKVSKGMISFALGIMALTGALSILGKLPFGVLLQGGVSLLGLMSILALYVKMVNGKDWAKASGGMLGFGVGLIALTGSLAILGNLQFGTIAKGTVALLGLLSVLALFIKLTNGGDLAVSGGSLVGLGIGLMALTGALALLGTLDLNQLVQGGAAITVLMAAIAAFIKLTNGADLGVTAGAMIAFATGVGILAGVLALLTLIDTSALSAAAVSIGGIITAIGLFTKVTNLGGLAGSALGLGLFALALAGLSLPIKMIAEIPWQQLVATGAVIISTVGMFAVVAAIMPAFAAVGAIIPAALLGVLGVGAIITALGLVLVAIGALYNIPGVDNLINDGGAALMSIGTALGNFVGGIVGGIGVGVTASLPEMADNITAFGIGITPFFEAISNVNADGVQAVKYLAETLLILGAAKITDALTSWLTGGVSLTDFGKELTKFAPYFVRFSDIITSGNINSAVINNTGIAIKTMAEAASGLPNQGASIAKWFVGDNTLSVFGKELAKFAPKFVEFSNIITSGNIDNAVVSNTAVAVQAMSEVANGLPNQGGTLVKWFVGDNTLSVFGKELSKFAPRFIDFADRITAANINTDVIKNTSLAVQTMTKVATGLPNQGGAIAAWFTGDNTLSTFGKELAKFAPNFVEFSDVITKGNINNAVVKNAATAAATMAELASGLPAQHNDVVKWFVGDNTLSTFAKELTKFAPEFGKFATEFGKVDVSTISPALDALNLLVDTLQISGSDALHSLAEGFEKNKESNIRKIKVVLEDIVKSINDYSSRFTTSGVNVIKGFIKGITSQRAEVKTAVQENVVDIVDNIIHSGFDMHSPSKTKEEDGKNIMQGLINGIKEKKDALISSVESVVTDVNSSLDTTPMTSSLTSGLEGLLASLSASFNTGGTDVGNAFESGFGDSGFTNALNGVTKGTEKIKTAFEKFKEWMDEQKFYSLIDTSGEIDAWIKQQDLYKKGSDERKEIDRELYTLKKQLIQETYQNEIDSMEKLNYYGQLSLQEELARYYTMRKEHAVGSEEREKIDREIYALEKKTYELRLKYIDDVRAAQSKADNDRLKAQQEYNNAVMEAEATASADRTKAQKKYDEAVASAEETANKDRESAYSKYNDTIQKATENAATDRIKLEEALAKDLLDIQNKLTTDLVNTEKKYTDALKARADTIYGYYGMFDEVSERTISTPEELLKNLSDQNAAVEDWRHSLEQLEARGVSDTLLKELQDLGVSSSGQLSAMLAMTDEQLSEFMALFDRKHELANTQAMDELVNYRSEINNEIAELYKQADADLEARVGKYNDALGDLNAALQSELDVAQTTLTDALSAINSTLAEKTKEAKTTLNETLTDVNASLQSNLNKAKATFDTTMSEILTTLDGQLTSLRQSFLTTMETVHDKSAKEYNAMNKDLKAELVTLNKETTLQLKELKTTTAEKTEEASTALSTNVGAGVTNSKESLQELNNSVTSIFSTFEQSLYTIGMNGARGLANGLRSGAYAVRIAGQYIGDIALSAAKAALDEHSPSKEMEEVGMFGDLGLVNGLMKYASKVADAGYGVGKTALDALTDSLSNMSSLNLDLLDLNPTITPVLDLSDIQRSSGLLSKMLSSGQSYALADASLIKAQKSASVQNGSSSASSTTPTSITNIYKLENLSVRRDTDIDLIANKLYELQESALRGRGLRPRLP